MHLFGLDPPQSVYDDPYRSKRVYVRSRLMYKAVAELEKIAGKVVEEYGDATLEQLLAPSSVVSARSSEDAGY